MSKRALKPSIVPHIFNCSRGRKISVNLKPTKRDGNIYSRRVLAALPEYLGLVFSTYMVAHAIFHSSFRGI